MVIPGQHQDAFHPGLAQPCQGCLALLTHCVAQGQHPDEAAAVADVEQGLALQIEAVQGLGPGADVYPFVFLDEVARAHHDALAVDLACDPVGDDELYLGVIEVTALDAAGCLHHGDGQRVEVVLLHRGGEPDEIVRRVGGIEGHRVGHHQIPVGQGAGLVEDEGIGFREALEGRGPLDENARLACGIHGRLERHRGGELEGAGVVRL
ncbi:hypothetical protein D3C79_588470 [compost metagenome]